MGTFCSQMFLKSSLQGPWKMRTIRQRRQENIMVAQVKEIVARSYPELVEDVLGLGVLFGAMFAVLTF
jgi:hypothetical protein